MGRLLCMGYESRLFIVEKKAGFDEKKAFWGEVIAMFDLRRCPSISDVLRDRPATNCYIYESDGNTVVYEDKYGKPLTESTLDVVIDLIEKKELSQEGRPYRRIEPLYAMLKSFKENEDQWGTLRVLHYGY